jgi:hypothetical protein
VGACSELDGKPVLIDRDIWWTALSKYSMEQVQAGFTAHIADPEHGNYPPKPAHIIKHIECLYPKRTGAYALYKPEPQEAGRRLPLTYEVPPAHFSHLMKRALLFAEGKGSDEDKHEHLQELIQIVKGMPLPYDKRATLDRFNAPPDAAGSVRRHEAELSTENVDSLEVV